MANRTKGTALAFSLLALLLVIGCSDSTAEDAGSAAAQMTPELEYLSPAFSITSRDLQQMISTLPTDVQAIISASPSRFLEQVAAVIELPYALTVLADKEHPLPEGYAPTAIVGLDQFEGELSLSREGHRLAQIAIAPLQTMNQAAVTDGIVLLVSSAYRSYEYQEQVYARWVSELGQAEADRVSARPGTSQHQLGTAVDFGCICPEFANQAAGKWLADNAHRFGFSLSYPEGAESFTGYSYEPWHFRYVGVEATMLEQEFFGGMQQWMLEWLAENDPVLRSHLEES